MEFSDYEIFRAINLLSRHLALTMVHRTGLLIFSIFTFYSLMTHQPAYSFYFVILLILFPIFAKEYQKRRHNRTEKSACKALFPTLCKKYHYSDVSCFANLGSFYVILIFLLLWQNNIQKTSGSASYLVYYFPFSCILLFLFLFLGLSIYFRFHIKNNLRKGVL